MIEKKVLVTSRSFGQVSDEAVRLLEEAGIRIDYMVSNFDLAKFEEKIPEYDALIIGAHPFRPELFGACPKLKIICKHGVGLDNIPVEAAHEAGVRVTNTPGTNSDAVADFAFALMLAAGRNLIYSVEEIKKGNVKPQYGNDVCGKTLGLLGFGAIARRVAKRAFGFDMTVLAYDPYVTAAPEGLEQVKLCTLEEVLKESDYVSIHLPITPQTRGMIGKEAFEMMKTGARLINTARGGIVDEAALIEAVSSGKLAAAALDVQETEPIAVDHPLLSTPGIIITNHVASYSKEALNAVSMICASNVINCLAGRKVLYSV